MAPSPKLIGKYEVLEELGRGGFAVVYKARDVELDRLVALKVLRPALGDDPDFVARFKQEARAAARLQHPNIVIVHDAAQIDGQLIIAMQYVEGRTLRDELQLWGALPIDKALVILEQIAGALDYAHLRGVVHRDVKPANILLEEAGQGVHATLLDFGLAKAMEASTVLTSQGKLLGSPEYMAPEQADPNRAHEVGPATDRYALGIVAYQLLIGRVPFPGNTSATLNAQLNLTPPDPHTLRSEVSPQVSAVLLKMLAKAPADRYASAREFVAALRMATVTPGASQVAVPRPAQGPIETARKPEVITPVPPIPRKGSGRVWSMLPWLLAVFLIGIVCYLIIRQLGKPTSPSIDSFTANPSTLTLGQCTTLSWRSTNVVTPIVLEVNKQTLQTNLPSSGSTSHCPTAMDEFVYYLTVTASSTYGPVSAKAVVNVIAPTPTPPPTSAIDSFTADPSTLTLGQCTTLSWRTTSVVTPIVLEGDGQTLQTNLPPSGSTSHCPTATGTMVYHLIVTTSPKYGQLSAEVTVNVVAPTPPPQPTPSIDSFTANPSTLTLGQCTTLRWQTTNVVTPIELLVNKQTLRTNLLPSGSTSHCPTTTGEFVYYLTVAASSTQGPVSATAVVNVVPPTPPPQPTSVIDSFTANPSTLTLGQCTTLRWQTTNVVTPITLEVNGQTLKTDLRTSDSTSDCPTATGEFVYFLIVTASSTQGPISATAVVNVAPKIETRTRATDSMTMVYVPAGKFKMGSDGGGIPMKPVHDVTLDAFWIDRTEVTNAQYAKCVSAGQCAAPSETKSSTRNSYYGNGEYADYPVFYVSWTDANNYCTWAGGQLPTEAQWEYAARGPNDYTYPWGNDPPNDRLLNYSNNVGDTTAVGSYPSGASWVGALDLAGNVWEYVQDWYGPYSSSAQTNPTGPTSGTSRGVRGGAWFSPDVAVIMTSRYTSPPDFRSGPNGLRCVVSPGG